MLNPRKFYYFRQLGRFKPRFYNDFYLFYHSCKHIFKVSLTIGTLKFKKISFEIFFIKKKILEILELNIYIH